jgi:hypothetical protein
MKRLMTPPLDVFSLQDGDGPGWLGSVSTLAKAIDLMRSSGAGSYMVFSQQTGEKNSHTAQHANCFRLLMFVFTEIFRGRLRATRLGASLELARLPFQPSDVSR